MIEDYLGIQIDYSKEETLSDFSLDTLKDRYFWKEEKYAQQALARASVYCATYQGVSRQERSNSLLHADGHSALSGSRGWS